MPNYEEPAMRAARRWETGDELSTFEIRTALALWGGHGGRDFIRNSTKGKPYVCTTKSKSVFLRHVRCNATAAGARIESGSEEIRKREMIKMVCLNFTGN